eukprot:15127861-Alexandrium_andersonii.AAC.1
MEDGATPGASTPAAASEPPEPTRIRVPEGEGLLVDLGGAGECAWRALAYLMARSRGEPKDDTLTANVPKLATSMQC